MPTPSWSWRGADEGVGAEVWAYSHDHPDQLTGTWGAVKTIFLEIDKPHRAVREWHWMTQRGLGGESIDAFVPLLAEPTIMTVTLTQTRNPDGEAETLIQIDHARVPVEWADDLAIYWDYQLSIADHAHFGTRK